MRRTHRPIAPATPHSYIRALPYIYSRPPQPPTTPNSVQDASSFNQLLPLDTSSVTDMSQMFEVCPRERASSWFLGLHCTHCASAAVSQLLTSCHTLPTLQRAKAFNQPLILNTSSVTNMASMFGATSAFNQPLILDTSSVTSMVSMFILTRAFNQPLILDTSSVKNMRTMFKWTKAFNQPLSLNTSRVTDMQQMFAVCSCARLIPAQQFCVPTADPHLTPCRIRAPF